MRSRVQVITDFISAISESTTGSYDTQVGEPLRDLLIDTPSKEFEKVYLLLDLYQKMQSLDGFLEIDESYKTDLVNILGLQGIEVDTLVSDSLDKLVGNYSISRKSAVATIGTVRFYCSTKEQVVISKGIHVETLGISPIVFEVMEDFSGLPLVEEDTGKYYIDRSVEALVAGVSGNVPAKAIQVLPTPILGVSSVVNIDSFSGGLDIESDLQLIYRAKEVFVGRNRGVIDGYKSLVLGLDGVRDASVIDMSNSSYKRGIGSCDMIFIGEKLDNYSFTIAYNNEDIVLVKQPVISIVSVVGSKTYVEGTDFDLVFDTGIYAESIKDRSYIKFREGKKPLIGESLLITYQYNSLVEAVQNVLDDSSNRVLGVDVLVKQAVEEFVDISVGIIIYFGYNIDAVKLEVTNVLTEFFSYLGLGDSIEVSDMLRVITGVDGVDRINTQTFVINSKTISEVPGGILTVSDDKYFKLRNLIFL